MEYIKRSNEPQYLSNNKKQLNQPWIDFYQKNKDINGNLIRDKKPTDNNWTRNEVRNILISDFKNNCGYCGCSRPTPQSSNDKEKSPRGHVDHYRAKAIYPALTYEWSNYIWSCEACNVEKGEFDDPKDPILNPCVLDDCNILEFVIDTGKYCLHDPESICSKRFKNTDKVTMLNSREISIRRRNRIKNLKSLFKSTSLLINANVPVNLTTIINDNITNIIDSLEDEEFYFLIQKEYNSLKIQYPKIEVLINKLTL